MKSNCVFSMGRRAGRGPSPESPPARMTAVVTFDIRLSRKSVSMACDRFRMVLLSIIRSTCLSKSLASVIVRRAFDLIWRPAIPACCHTLSYKTSYKINRAVVKRQNQARVGVHMRDGAWRGKRGRMPQAQRLQSRAKTQAGGPRGGQTADAAVSGLSPSDSCIFWSFASFAQDSE